MKLFRKALILLSVAAFPNAHAAPITFTDTYDPTDVLISTFNGIKFGHNILDDGFDSSTDTIQFVSLTIDAYDDGDLDTIISQQSYDCGLPTPCVMDVSTTGELEVMKVLTDGLFVGNNEVNTSPFIFYIDPAFLADGILNVDVLAALGDFYFRSSTLTVTVERQGQVGTTPAPTTSVPAPSAFALLGAGLLGVGYARRKNRN